MKTWSAQIFVFCLLIFVGIGMVTSSSMAEENTLENLLVNPGFEKLEDGMPVSWAGNSSWNSGTIDVLPEAARTGNYGIKIETDRDNWVRQIVEVEAGKFYEWSSWFKSDIPFDSNGRIQMKVEFYQDTLDVDGFLGDIFSDGLSESVDNWKKYKLQMETPPETNLVQVYLRLYGPGTVYYDDASFHKIDRIELRGLQVSSNEKFYYENITEGTIQGKIGLEDGHYDDKVLEVQIKSEEDGKVVVHEIGLPATENFQFTFDPSLMNLQEPYEMNVKLNSKEGETLDEYKETIYRWQRPTSLREDGTIMVEGKPFFPVIGYHVPVNDYPKVTNTINTVQGLQQSPARFDLNTVKRSLDEAHKYGLKMLVPLYPDVWNLDGPRGYEYVQEKVSMFKDHPAVLGWMILDEPSMFINQGHPDIYEALAEVYRITRSLDEVHPTYTVLNLPRDFAMLGKLTDIFVVDPYPLVYPPQPITLVSEHVREAKRLFPHKPVWGILQAFMFPDNPSYPYLPNITELRHMVYQTVLEGAQGLGYYSFTDPGWDLMKSELYPGIVEFTKKEIPYLSDVILNGQQIDHGKDGYVQWGVWENGNDLYAVAINLTEETQTAVVSLPNDDGYDVKVIAPDRQEYNTFKSELSIELSGLESKLISLKPPASSDGMKTKVENFASEGEFEVANAVHALQLHLTAVNQFERQGKADKVVKHMEGFTLLLEHQRNNQLISMKAYQALQADADALVQRMAESLLQKTIQVENREVVAGETLQVRVELSNRGTETIHNPALIITWPEVFGLEPAEVTIRNLHPGQTEEVLFEAVVQSGIPAGEYTLTVHTQFEHKDVYMQDSRSRQINVLPVIRAALDTDHVMAKTPGEYPISFTLTNNASRLIDVTFQSAAHEALSLNVGGVQIAPYESIVVKGVVSIQDTIMDGEHTVMLHAMVDGKQIQSIPITIDYNTNLVRNPGFEQGDVTPNHWWIQSSANWEWVEDEVHSGRYALTLFPGPSGTGGVNTRENIPVTAGKTYRVTYWAKNSSTNGGSFDIRKVNENNSTIKYIFNDVQRNVDWTKHTFTFVPEEGTESVGIYLRLGEEADGQIWFDDIRIEEVPAGGTANLVKNPSFEEGESRPNHWWIQSTANWEWVQDEIHSGKYAVTLYPGPSGTSGINTRDHIPVTAGKTYRVTYWAKNSSTNGGSFDIRKVDENNSTIKYIFNEVQRDVDWTEHTFTFVPEEGTAAISIYLRLEGDANGQVWFDDIHIEEVTE